MTVQIGTAAARETKVADDFASDQAGRTRRKGVLVSRCRMGLSRSTAASVDAGSDLGDTARIDPP